MFQLPSEVKIGPITYRVQEDSRTAAEGYFGTIHYGEELISLQPGLSDTFKEITLFHEILHGMLLQGGIRDHDERILDVLSHGLVQLKRDNPALFQN